MKSPHFVVSLFLALSAVVTSCSRPTKFSNVYDGGFDPVTAFRQHGYTVEKEARGEGIRNEANGYAWESWCGVLPDASAHGNSKAIPIAIRDELNKALSGMALDELTVGAGPTDGKPLTGMLRYNKDKVHGDMHVWLMPSASNNVVSYVIFLREERYK